MFCFGKSETSRKSSDMIMYNDKIKKHIYFGYQF